MKEAFEEILYEAELEGFKAANEYFQDTLGGTDNYPCGFAWVNIYSFNGKKLAGNTKAGKALKAAGVKQNYERKFQVWNPSNFNCQNVDAKRAGADAFAKVLERYGFVAYAGDRLD